MVYGTVQYKSLPVITSMASTRSSSASTRATGPFLHVNPSSFSASTRATGPFLHVNPSSSSASTRATGPFLHVNLSSGNRFLGKSLSCSVFPIWASELPDFNGSGSSASKGDGGGGDGSKPWEGLTQIFQVLADDAKEINRAAYRKQLIKWFHIVDCLTFYCVARSLPAAFDSLKERSLELSVCWFVARFSFAIFAKNKKEANKGNKA